MALALLGTLGMETDLKFGLNSDLTPEGRILNKIIITRPRARLGN